MPDFGNFSLRRRATQVLVAFGCGLVAASASATPESDQVMKLLAERGLLAPELSAPATAQVTPAAGTVADASLARKQVGLVDQVRDSASDMVITAMKFLGVPYRRGGTDETTGFDCSGFTRHVFEMSLGLVLPRRADEQASAKGMLAIDRNELRPGDLVFFNTLRRTFSHVGIYIGDGKFIHAPRAGGRVRVEDMSIAYWSARFTGARRVDALNTDTSVATSAR